MSSEYVYEDGERPPARSWLSILILPALAFLAGLLAMGWLLIRWDEAGTFLGIRDKVEAEAPAPPAARAQPPEAAVGGDARNVVIDPEITRRVTQLERRLAALDNQSRQAVGNVDRAEGLLVAFAARRALDRGVPLGYIENLLRQRFGNSQRQAVATIITASREPVTLQDLQEGLQEIGPDLVGGGPNENWLTALRREFSGLVTIRRRGAPSTLPAERLRRAERRLEAGQVDVALAEVLRMPGRDNAADWIAAARRYVGARRALDQIESATLMDTKAAASAAVPHVAAARPAG